MSDKALELEEVATRKAIFAQVSKSSDIITMA